MEALCIFFDLEATGLFIQYAEVVEIASVARLLSSEGLWQDSSWSPTGGEFRILVRPKKKLPRKIARMTGLSNAQLQRDGVRFQAAIGAWVAWLRSETAAVDKARGKHIPLWLIGHNAMTYDLPLLVAQDRREHLSSAAATLYVPPCPVAPFEGVDNLAGVLDTLRISRALAKARKSSKDVLSMGRRLQHRQSGQSSKTSHALGALYRRALGHPLPAAHSALGDARGLAAICSRSPLHHAVFSAVAGSTFSMAAGALQTLPALSAARQMALRAAGLGRDRRHGRKQKAKGKGPRQQGAKVAHTAKQLPSFGKRLGGKRKSTVLLPCVHEDRMQRSRAQGRKQPLHSAASRHIQSFLQRPAVFAHQNPVKQGDAGCSAEPKKLPRWQCGVLNPNLATLVTATRPVVWSGKPSRIQSDLSELMGRAMIAGS